MSGRYRVLYTSHAIDDLRHIHEYVAVELRSSEAASKLLTKIRDAARSLERMPMRHPVARQPSLAAKGIRQMTVGSHVLLYHVDEGKGELTIVRVAYGSRDLGQIARELD